MLFRSQELGRLWGQSVVTENRVGAGGVAAADAVAKSAPDGYSILMADDVPLAVTPLLVARLPYDSAADFTPVIALVQSSHVLVVESRNPAKSVQELIAAARARPGEVNYGSFGVAAPCISIPRSSARSRVFAARTCPTRDRKSTRLNSSHT